MPQRPHQLLLAAGLVVTVVMPDTIVADEQSGQPLSPPCEQLGSEGPDQELTPEAQRVAEELKSQLREGSEARAMLDAILDGSQLGPGEGWFGLAASQTRFDWNRVRDSYDTDSDSMVSPDEFHGTAADFACVDRDTYCELTESDFDWTRHSLERTPGAMLFSQADQDANGKLEREELFALFRKLDTDSRGFLSLDDVREQFQPRASGSRTARPDAPSRSTLLLGLQRQEIGSLQPGPDVGDSAPDFTLSSLDGRSVTLSEQVGEQPVVLIFGNFTCGPFRSQSGNITKLYERYKDRAKFFLIYVREAHPSDGWWMDSNQRVGIDVAQPQQQQERVTIAATCQRHLDIDMPFLVDAVDDRVGAAYSGMPNRLYLIDNNGTIAFKNGRGPFGFHPRELEQALALLLNEKDRAAGESQQ